MKELTHRIKNELLRLGADIVGFGGLDELPVDVRDNLPVGISVAVVYPPEVIRGITKLPTQEYRLCKKREISLAALCVVIV